MMNRTPITIHPEAFPEQLRSLLTSCGVYDSSCSPEARVYFLDQEEGLYLKTAPAGTLQTEAAMTAYFQSHQLSAQVLAYLPLEQDWLLTRRIPGEDCTHPTYLEDPIRLCDTTAQLLRQLHELEPKGCPVSNRNQSYIQTARQGKALGRWDDGLFQGLRSFSCAEEAWNIAEETFPHLKPEVLLHGDYCLPNILLNHWQFSGFIDVGSGGIGDRHIDLFWGAWTLFFNLKTTRYTDRFLDAYGRDKIQPELLRGIAAIETFG